MDKITPEQEDILRHHPASPAAERIREERSKAAWAEREAAEQAKRDAAQAYIIGLENALSGIGDLVGVSLGSSDPDTIRRRVKDIRTERDTAQARAKELEDELLKARAAKCLDEVDDFTGMVVTPNADPTHSYNAEIVAARIDALKTLGVNPYDPPVCIAGTAKKRAKTLEHADKLESDVVAVWELWGAGREVKPGALLEVCQEQEQHLSAAQGELDVIAEKLDCAKVPAHYGRDQKGGPIPLPERVSVLIAAHDQAMHESKNWMDATMREAGEATDAHLQLDDLGAPRHAGSTALSISARIRALPGLLRAE